MHEKAYYITQMCRVALAMHHPCAQHQAHAARAVLHFDLPPFAPLQDAQAGASGWGANANALNTAFINQTTFISVSPPPPTLLTCIPMPFCKCNVHVRMQQARVQAQGHFARVAWLAVNAAAGGANRAVHAEI